MKSKRLIENTILFAMDSLSKDIQTSDPESAEKFARAMYLLAVSYNTIRYKKRGTEQC